MRKNHHGSDNVYYVNLIGTQRIRRDLTNLTFASIPEVVDFPRPVRIRFFPAESVSLPMATSNSRISTARSVARSIIEDPAYQFQLKIRAIAGDLPPQIEKELWDRAYGKVTEQIRLTQAEEDLSELSDEQLEAELASMLARQQSRIAAARKEAAARTNDDVENSAMKSTVN